MCIFVVRHYSANNYCLNHRGTGFMSFRFLCEELMPRHGEKECCSCCFIKFEDSANFIALNKYPSRGGIVCR